MQYIPQHMITAPDVEALHISSSLGFLLGYAPHRGEAERLSAHHPPLPATYPRLQAKHTLGEVDSTYLGPNSYSRMGPSSRSW